MSKGIYTAVSGAMAQASKMDTIANNLANVNTPGFKRDAQIFKEYISAYEKEPTTITVPRIPASIESFYDMQGGDKSYVDVAGTATDFTQGGSKQTGNSLDLALEGDGFFEVLTPEGVRLTRRFIHSDNQGRVTTKQGFPVLKEGVPGTDPQGRFIQTNGGEITVSDDGQILENGVSTAGKLSIVNVANKDGLHKVGNNFWGFKETIQPELSTSTNSKVIQGFVESSNVNIVAEMSDMITATRTFESTQKAIQAYDEMQKRLVNDVPKIG